MNRTKKAELLIKDSIERALLDGRDYLLPEHLLRSFTICKEGEDIFKSYNVNPRDVFSELDSFLEADNHPIKKRTINNEIELSFQMSLIMQTSEMKAVSAGKDKVDVPHMIHALLELEDSMASYILRTYTTLDETELMCTVIAAYEGEPLPKHLSGEGEEDDDSQDFDEYDSMFGQEEETEDKSWRSLVTCINDQLDDHNPLIGREHELDRTIQVLCRKDKNNPLHVGEPGVGKTALIYGLAERIQKCDVPLRLLNARIYQMDLASMVAGTSYRGDFEKRLKKVMDGVANEGNSIIYIDEIHNIIGAGSAGEGSLDASNILKPYLENGKIRFIGSTTYQEYNRHLRQSKGFVRRFQQIDIPEPSIAETVQILKGLQKKYEKFHGCVYVDGVLEHAVNVASKYINDRFLPDKAIDLIDEAGSYRQMHPLCRHRNGRLVQQNKQPVDKALVNQVVARICKIELSSLDASDNENLEDLSQRVSSEIYGQHEAVRQVVEAVQMGKAGLLDEGKPIASMLFVGPTGVGKTEVCKVLAKELGISLIRFDMSEYTEKHAVAKLIGTPAGYVGYDDGGLLTDAIRKTPNCVLLLDEIEKAHSDIYNILLQVMDYASLTDNKGNKADFRNVILVMTSNAGAQYAHQASIGFASSVSVGSAMLQAVKKTFKPEFLARLSGTIVFNDMNRTMASMILDKKLRQLSQRLATRKVTMKLTLAAHDFLLDRGFTQQLGAREMDRQINALLNPLLMREILFGRLKKGGEVFVDVVDETLTLSV